MHETSTTTTTLLHLPPELLQHVLSHLEPPDLARTAVTSRLLRHHSHHDHIWQPLVNRNLPRPIPRPHPMPSFRHLYIAHHPHWFLPRHRLWFADSVPAGNLLVARYNPDDASIEAHAVVATRGRHAMELWEKDRKVIIHHFHPAVTRDTTHPPVLKLLPLPLPLLPPEREMVIDASSPDPAGWCRRSFMLCRALPDTAISDATRVWPPLRIPAHSRVRNETGDAFPSAGRHPRTQSEISPHHFRLRNGMRIPDDDDIISTYATLPESCYTPTATKPWQGIWCGDYSGHGCEFLVISQPDRQDERPLPRGMDWLHGWFRHHSPAHDRSSSTASDDIDYAEAARERAGTSELSDSDSDSESDEHESPPREFSHWFQRTWHDDVGSTNPNRRANGSAHPSPSDGGGGGGRRLEATKLTGDPNIPRAEYSFIAPDIGPRGFMRVADEDIFRGARVVRSAGHIAGRGFMNDQYTPSQLIMISPDRLAQFWQGFGHISFYQRVDVDALVGG